MTEKTEKKSPEHRRDLDWFRTLYHMQVVNSFGIVGLYLMFYCYFSTFLYTVLLIILGVLGTTAGAHRLWSHNSYKASTGLRVFLMLCQTLAVQGSIYDWVRWHRLHHKYFRTNLDPCNPNEGFFYAHIKNLCLKLSPAQEKALAEIDMSDIEKDSVVMWQKKYFYPLIIGFSGILAVNTPAEYWGEALFYAPFVTICLRVAVISQICNCIHSATLIWGLQPGEKYPSDTNLVFILTKTNWLSYHYLAPWDVQTGEFGKYAEDCVTRFIKICVILGCASDLKTIDSNSIRMALYESMEGKELTECLLKFTKVINGDEVLCSD